MNKILWESFIKEASTPYNNKSLNDLYNPYESEEEIDKLLQDMGIELDQDEQESNNVLEENVDIITKKLLSTLAARRVRELYNLGQFDNTPLSTISLKKFLGAGSYSTAFEDDSGHVIKIGEIRQDNSTDIDFYKKYYKKPSKNFIIHYFKLFNGPAEKIFIAITNKLLTFREYCNYKNSFINNKNIHQDEIETYPLYLTNLSSEINYARIQLAKTLPKIRNTFPTKNITYPTLYKKLLEEYPDSIEKFYSNLLSNFGLSRKDSHKILTEIIKVYCTQIKPDISFNNLGVNITAGINNPSFFFFDV